MNHLFKYLSAGLLMSVAAVMTGCSDKDGEGEFEWTGSQNPENTSYRNPVWEPSLAGGTVFKGASSFNAISQETQWAVGLDYVCPSLQSADLMSWSSNQQAFSVESRPEWISGKIDHVSADFARTISGANYWMIYSSSADNSFGAASAPSGMGPYSDLGSFLTAQDLGTSTLSYPHFSVIASTTYYLGYSTENGSYIQQLTIKKGAAPTLRGEAMHVSGAGFYNICIFRKDKDNFYLFGTVQNNGKTEIRYARASKINGPYLDRNGADIASGSTTGELLVTDGEEYVSPCNPMHMFESENGYFYLAYNAQATGREQMPSGYDRKPMFVSPIQMDEDGWFSSTAAPIVGWTSPRYQ